MCARSSRQCENSPDRHDELAQVPVVAAEPIEAMATATRAEEVVIAVAVNEAEWADQSATVLERIVRLETQLSGGPGTGNLQDRLDVLEGALLGTRSSGSMTTRICTWLGAMLSH